MKYRFYFFICGILLFTSCKQEELQSPNILFILIDDMGYKDLGCYGSDFYETPNIDRLAANGLKFMNAYAASAVCSPTRASILTGKNPARHKVSDWTGPANWHPDGPLNTSATAEFIPPEEYTLAEALSDHGYATCYLGKWHLGDGPHLPGNYGFEKVIGAINAGAPPSYFYPYLREGWAKTGWPIQIEDLVEGGNDGEYLTDRLTTEAINFIDTVTRPFLVYLAHYAVHTPLEAKPKLVEKYEQKAREMYPDTTNILIRDRNKTYTRIVQNHAIYGAMIESVDESIGRLVAELEEKEILDNTVIIFTSDNGGYSTSNFPLPVKNQDTIAKLPTSVMPYRMGKGWYYEGGIKIPTIVRWPGVTKEGEVIHERIVSTDFYPTMLDIAGIDLIPDQHKDGVSIVPLLKNSTATLSRKSIFWHYPHYHNSGQTPATAMIRDDFKFIWEYDGNRQFLYHLTEDIHEDHNLVAEQSGRAEEMLLEMKAWLEETGAALPEK